MNNFFFHNPTKILFGKGVLEKLASELKTYGTRILIVYGGGSIKKTGLYDKIINDLSKQNIEIFELSGVKSNPVVSLVRKGISLVRNNGIQVILAVGGGSVMDTSKAVAAGAMVDHDVWDFFSRKEKIEKALPLVMVPTRPASASEMNGGAVITNDETNQKLGAGGGALYSKVSLLDPELTFSVSTNITACAAADTISHIFEPYFNGANKNTKISDSLAEAVIKIVIETTPKALMNQNDYNARGDLMWAATIAHNGMLSFGTNPVWYYLHAIEHPLSALYDVPHAAGISIIIVGWTKYTAEHTPSKLAQLGRNIFNFEGDGKETALQTANKFEEWLKSIKCPTTLKEVGITEDKFEAIANNALLNVANLLKNKNKENLKHTVERFYSEARSKDIESLLKFEKARILNILKLCN
jgi:hypothetical protein